MTDARIEKPDAAASGSAALRIAVVGPTHPHRGGVAAHTTVLAHHLSAAGHDVVLVSWVSPYPSRLRRAEARLTSGAPEVTPYPRTIRALSWARPDTWVRAGRRLRDVDAVVVVHLVPSMAPAHLALLGAAGALPGRTTGPPVADAVRPQSVLLCHDVLPREHRVGDRVLMARLLTRVDAVLVHSVDQAQVAHDLGARRVSVAELPSHLPGGGPIPDDARPRRTRLLALGPVREHEGIDVLLRAMRGVPDVTLTIAGEVVGGTRAIIGSLAADPSLAGRVEIRDGDVPADELATLLAGHDVLALAYGSPTASQDVALAHAHGLPVLAPDTAPFAQQVTDGVSGLLVPAEDEQALAAALRRLGEPDQRRRLADGVRTPDLSGPWAHYLGTIEALSIDEQVLGLHPGAAVDAARVDGKATRAARLARAAGGMGDRVGAGLTAASRTARRTSRSLTARRSVLDLGTEDLPGWVLASDVLGDPAQADAARQLSRFLGLPRSIDRVSTWAALGALAAIIRVRDDGHRSAVIVDESGTRSLLSRWARAVGFAPVEIDFTGSHPHVAALDIDAGSLDVIVRIHPRGCDGEDVDHVLEQASWALRSGGLLIVTIPIGPPSADGAVGPADVRGIMARSHELGFVLVGDLDGDVTSRMRDARARARADDAAYGLVRLTLRRR